MKVLVSYIRDNSDDTLIQSIFNHHSIFVIEIIFVKVSTVILVVS